MITKINEFKLYLESVKIPDLNNFIKDKYLLIKKQSRTIEFIIQDKSKIYCYAELLIKNNQYQIINVGAEKGFGPYLYDIIMLYLDKSVRPNRSLSLPAFNVQENYYKNRQDIIKSIINTDLQTSIDLNNKEYKDSKYLNIINTLYTINDNNRKNIILQQEKDSFEFITTMENKLPGQLDIRFNQGKKYFYTKYDSIL